MLTDDPGTPGDGNWEINWAVLCDYVAGIALCQAPLIDLNYGVGERLQLKFEMPWLVERSGEDHREAAGNGLVGVKWRFYDEGDEGWHVSTYPQLQFGFPIGHSSGNKLADPGTDLLVPLELEHDGPAIDADIEVGRWFGQSPLNDMWTGGVAVGHEVWPKLELLAELHGQRMVAGGRNELTANFGLRWNWSHHFSLLASAGHDFHDSLGPRNILLTYLGLQTRF